MSASPLPTWLEGLDHRDWLFDGSPVRGKVMLARFNNLDWEKAWVDLGPSIAGNFGPYWHVPLKETVIDGDLYDCGDTVHRLYPKLLMTKWLWLVRQAIDESVARALRARVPVVGDREALPQTALSPEPKDQEASA